MSANGNIGREILVSRYFEIPLLKDIKYCLSEVERIDPDFLRLACCFTKFVLSNKRNGANKMYATARNQI